VHSVSINQTLSNQNFVVDEVVTEYTISIKTILCDINRKVALDKTIITLFAICATELGIY
jgi:hypothetical protein